jgi:hypothetical protein
MQAGVTFQGLSGYNREPRGGALIDGKEKQLSMGYAFGAHLFPYREGDLVVKYLSGRSETVAEQIEPRLNVFPFITILQF